MPLIAKRLLIIAEEVNYDRTSCGLLNAKIIHAVAPHFDCTVLTEGHIPADFGNFYSGKLIHFNYRKPALSGILSKIPLLRNLVAYTTGMHHASYYKYTNWKFQLTKLLSRQDEFDGILQLGTGMGWYSFMAMAHLPAPLIPLAGNIHDPFPMALLPPPYNPPWVLSERKLKRMFTTYLSRCKVNWAPSLRLLEWMQAHYPVLVKQGIVMPHLALQPPFDQKLRAVGQSALTSSIAGLHTKHNFLLVHMGSLLEGRTPAFLFEALEQLLATYPEVTNHLKVVFIGKVHPKLQQAFATVKSHPNYIIDHSTRISYQQALALQQSATANLTVEAVEFASPQLFGKFADSVLANRPIFSIGPAGSEMRRLLASDWPYQATNGDAAEIFAGLEKLYKAWLHNHNLQLNRPDLAHHCHPMRAVEAVEKLWE